MCSYTEGERAKTLPDFFHFKALITMYSTPKNKKDAKCHWVVVAGETASRVQVDFSGGRGTVMCGTGTLMLGFFISCYRDNRQNYFTKGLFYKVKSKPSR